MRYLSILLVLLLAFALVACDIGEPAPEVTLFETPTPEPTETPVPTPTPTPPPDPTPVPTPTPTPLPDPTPMPPDPRGVEPIVIEQPGPGSRVVSPVTVAGVADPAFEQTLVVRILLADGTVIAEVPVMIEAELGERGPYSVDVLFELDEDQQGFIQVFHVSARDGGVLQLNSVGVLLATDEPEEIVFADPQPAQIAIFEPSMGDTVSGGVAYVEGFALASFEQTLVVRVLDADGNMVGEEPIMVDAPDLGEPGPYSAEVSYTVTEAGPGRIVVIDPSPAHGDDVYRTSVEIELLP